MAGDLLPGWGVALGMALLAAGCGAGRSAVKKDLPQDSRNSQSAPESARPPRNPDERVTAFDLNGDQKPDVWTFTVVRKDADGRELDQLARKELDINWDGKIDLTRFYDERGSLAREELDLNFDGRVDQAHFYEAGHLVRKELDVDYDGRPDQWSFYERGKLLRKERDTNSDGKVDYWEYWEGDQVDRVGEDVDGDGVADRWTSRSASAGEG
jgi:hypothetical protein